VFQIDKFNHKKIVSLIYARYLVFVGHLGKYTYEEDIYLYHPDYFLNPYRSNCSPS